MRSKIMIGMIKLGDGYAIQVDRWEWECRCYDNDAYNGCSIVLNVDSVIDKDQLDRFNEELSEIRRKLNEIEKD